MTQSGESFFLDVAGVSDTGKRRSNNEDAIWWRHETTDAGTREALLVVADGMGGAAAGEVASHAAVETCTEALSGDLTPAELPARLTEAVRRANTRIYAAAQENEQYHGMGTTLSVAAIVDAQLYVAHVGDSRCYLIRQGRAAQITTDHTWVAEEVKSGRLAAEDAEQHPARKAISRSVGTDPGVEVDVIGPIELSEDDMVLLCSDGLSDVVEDREIGRLASSRTPAETAQRLVHLANSRGGPDNVSVVTARVTAHTAAAPFGAIVSERSRRYGARTALAPRRSFPMPIVLAAPAALALLIGGGLGVLALSSGGDESPSLVIRPTERAEATATLAPATGRSSPTPARSSPKPSRVLRGANECDSDGSPAFGYKVKENETLYDIAFGRDLVVEAIIDCDQSIEDPDSIRAGQTIKIPCLTSEPCPSPEEQP